MTRYDYVVIGAGSAGCVVANRLTEDPDTTVLLLEAGNPATKSAIQTPSGWMSLLGTEVDWAYWSEPEPHLDGRKILCLRGRVVGGSSSINVMIYIRGNRHNFDAWQALGNLGWSYEEVLPYFKKSEHQQRGASQFHGIDGALSVTDPIAPSPINEQFIAAAAQLGYDRNLDFNGAHQEGAGLYQLTVKDGRRHSAAAAFLVPILDRPNLVEAGLFLHSDISSETAPDLQFLFSPALWMGSAIVPDVPGFTFILALLNPQSRGTVSLRSANPADPPVIQANYLQHERDLQVLVEGIKTARQLAHADAFAEILGEELAPGAAVSSDEAIGAYIRQAANTFWHPVGTCKMGGDALTVVDAQLRVHGIDGLRVVDASIMPTIPSGNTNASTIMIGEKGADFIQAADRTSRLTRLTYKT